MASTFLDAFPVQGAPGHLPVLGSESFQETIKKKPGKQIRLLRTERWLKIMGGHRPVHTNKLLYHGFKVVQNGNEKVRPVVKSSPFKTNMGKHKIVVSANRKMVNSNETPVSASFKLGLLKKTCPHSRVKGKSVGGSPFGLSKRDTGPPFHLEHGN